MANKFGSIFIDTNIFLDFYRMRGSTGGLSMLDHIDKNRDRIITSEQVEMEYKKNRQNVILESIAKIKPPEWGGLTVPAFLAESKPTGQISKAKKAVTAQAARIKGRLSRILMQPMIHDSVYKTAQRLFKQESELNLSRDKKERIPIRHLARKRFMLGYPPKKNNDLSIGDAINWEWIISCATNSKTGVVIVSRDSDYGCSHNDAPLINDWLRYEFQERVGRKPIVLTDKLSEAFKHLSISVTSTEVAAEETLVKDINASKVVETSTPSKTAYQDLLKLISTLGWDDVLTKSLPAKKIEQGLEDGG